MRVDASNSRSRLIAFLVFALFAVWIVTAAPLQAAACENTSTGLVPLNDLGTGTYQGEMGGLYPGGSNEIPPEHLEIGLKLAEQVVPRAEDGTPDESGKIGFISIGVSNTGGKFNAFIEKLGFADVNPRMELVNGAQVGRAIGQWASNRSTNTWDRLRRNLEAHGVTAEQVQVAWLMLPGRSRGPRTLDDARKEMAAFTRVLQHAKERYPNLVLAYLSSRAYGGYIPDSDSEPNAYHHGFEMKWMIEEQINGSPELNPDPEAGTVLAPWIAWGPYLWADGTNPRSDGLSYACEDFAIEGVHPAEGAMEKVSTLMMDHFSTHPTTVGWFLGSEGSEPISTTTTAVPETTLETTPPEELTTTSSLPQPESTVAAQEEAAEEGSAESNAPSIPWPAALTGVGVGLVLGALIGFLVLRARS